MTIFWSLMFGLCFVILTPFIMDNLVETRALLPKILYADPVISDLQVTFEAHQYIGNCDGQVTYEGIETYDKIPTVKVQSDSDTCTIVWECEGCTIVSFPVSNI